MEQLLACVDVLLRQCDSDCSSVSLQLLQVLVTVQSLSTEMQLSDKVREQKQNQSISAIALSHVGKHAFHHICRILQFTL